MNDLMRRVARAGQTARRVWDKSGQVIAFLLFFCSMFFGVSWLMFAPVQGVEAAPRPAVTQHDGRDVAIVAYERRGPRGMWQLMTGDFGSTRVAALDIATGDLLWDVGIGDSVTYEPRIVAADGAHVYVAASDGRWVLSLDGGRIVTEPADDGTDPGWDPTLTDLPDVADDEPVVGASGASVILGEDTLFNVAWLNAGGQPIVLIAPDGTRTTSTIGRMGFFGEPL